MFDRYGTVKDSWQNSEPTVRETLKKAAESIVSEKCDNEEIRNILKSTTERQLEYALSKFLCLKLILPCFIYLFSRIGRERRRNYSGDA